MATGREKRTKTWKGQKALPDKQGDIQGHKTGHRTQRKQKKSNRNVNKRVIIEFSLAKAKKND